MSYVVLVQTWRPEVLWYPDMEEWMWDAWTTAWGSPTNEDYARAYWHWQNTLAKLRND